MSTSIKALDMSLTVVLNLSKYLYKVSLRHNYGSTAIIFGIVGIPTTLRTQSSEFRGF
jgi:hypothetical protein